MLNKINNVNFTASVVRNDAFYEGIKQAKKDAGKDYRYTANEFANAVKYLENDGTDDVFEVVKDETNPHQYNLNRNGETINMSTRLEPGESVMNLFTNYVKFDLKKEIAKPFTPAMEYKVKLADLPQRLMDAETTLAKTRKDIKDIQEGVNKIVTDEVRTKLDALG